MAGYPQPPSGYGYPTPNAPPYGSPPYGSPPYGAPPPQQPYGSAPTASYGTAPYGSAPSAPYAPQSYQQSPGVGEKPQKPHKVGGGAGGGAGGVGGVPSGYPAAAAPQGAGAGAGGYGNPFASLVPSQFPPGTDPTVVSCFQMADQDRSGLIDDKELQGALSSYNQSFSLRTVHLLMYLFTNTNTRKIVLSGYHTSPPTAGAGTYGNHFALLFLKAFSPETDLSVVACFQIADQDGIGLMSRVE
ncbi:hypothetical protein GIB67_039654 [Kingdonia uniflora]|uniref:EF-hand domain-containing protein n=1 Tax=Kingdonia uniflora TaxID=39325 RepID=A0A7J7MDK8_9MAGN|nr:hypothetical protein GIB67_039654 [Kingdonia uniflora]